MDNYMDMKPSVHQYEEIDSVCTSREGDSVCTTREGAKLKLAKEYLHHI